MKHSVYISIPNSVHEQNQWSYALSHFKPEVVYTSDGYTDYLYSQTIQQLASPKELGGDIVVVTPKNGMNVQGEIILDRFIHPKNCTYIFGSDHVHLAEEDVPLQFVDKVYIPTDSKDEMYSWMAYAVVMWDRRMKHSG